MGKGVILVLAAALSLLLVVSSMDTEVTVAQPSAGSNWIRAGYDDNNSGFNPQTQINQNNVQNLQVKWTYNIPADPYSGALSSLAGAKTRPLVINGTVYIGTPFGRVIAINASDGSELWSFQSNVTALMTHPGAGGSLVDLHHITSYVGEIYMQAADCTIYGLDGKTGTIGLVIPDPCANIPGGQVYSYAGRSAPVLYEKGGVLILGEAGESTGRGFVAGYSDITGKLLWRWFVVPPQGGDPNWDSKYVVQLGNGSYVTGIPKGNVQPYKGDWGNSSSIVGGTSWDLNLVDQDTGIAYVATSVPMGPDMSLFPGPDLFGSSLVALNATTGAMLWYYQMVTHDIYSYGIGFQSGVLAQVQVGGKMVKAVLTDSKNGYAYAFNAKTGSMLWGPIKLSPQVNDANANVGSAANMTISQVNLVGKKLCPLDAGFAPQAYAYSTFYVAVQNNCGTPVPTGPNLLTGTPSWIYQPVGPTNSTIYALDGATGTIKWQYPIPDPYQGAALSVSGGVVYAVDRTGVFYALNADDGKLLKTMNLSGVGTTGVTIGADRAGEMRLFVASGGVGTTATTPGTVMALGLSEATIPGQTAPFLSQTEITFIVPLLVAGVILAVGIVYRRRKA